MEKVTVKELQEFGMRFSLTMTVAFMGNNFITLPFAKNGIKSVMFLEPLYHKQLVLSYKIEVVALQYENIEAQLHSLLKSGLNIRRF